MLHCYIVTVFFSLFSVVAWVLNNVKHNHLNTLDIIFALTGVIQMNIYRLSQLGCHCHGTKLL
jgi:hypothetical protein